MRIFLNTNIEVNIHTRIDNIQSQLSKGIKLNEDDDHFLQACLSNNLITSEINFISIFRNIFIGNKIISNETFQEVIKIFVQNTMHAINNHRIPHYHLICAIYDFNKVKGKHLAECTKYFRVAIHSNEIENIYTSHPFASINIFHELVHIMQEINIKLGYINDDIMHFIKDRILREIFSKEHIDYYSENYNVISFETDAEFNGYLWMLHFLTKDIGLKFSEDIMADIEKIITERQTAKSNGIRNVHGKSYQLNELFDEFIQNNPQYLEEYSQLTIEYIIEFGKVRRKNGKELMETYQEYEGNDFMCQYIEKAIYETNHGRGSNRL